MQQNIGEIILRKNFYSWFCRLQALVREKIFKRKGLLGFPLMEILNDGFF
jgi:hypothetical protein